MTLTWVNALLPTTFLLWDVFVSCISVYQIYGGFCCSFSVCPMWKLKSPSCPLLTKLRKLSTDVTNVTKIAISLGEFSTVKSELTGNCPAHMVSTSKQKVLLQEKWFCCCCYLVGGEGAGATQKQHQKTLWFEFFILRRIFVCLFSFVSMCNTKQFSSQENLLLDKSQVLTGQLALLS